MKKSQLKEAIKAEIKSVLSEDFNDDNRGLAYIKSDGERDGFESFTQYAGKQNLKNVPDLEAYTDGFAKGVMQKGNKLAQLVSRATRGGADAEPLMKMIGLKEAKKGVVVDPDEIMMHINQYQSGNIDGDDLAQAIEEILVAMMNKSVTFSDIREDEEPTSADLKKKDSVASISNKLQKLTAKMKKKAKEFKEAEGKAKDKIKDELKDMTAEKKKLEKDL